MKGPELADRLATVSPETLVLFMCGYIDNKAVEEQFKDRLGALLRKPFTRAELQRARESRARPLGTLRKRRPRCSPPSH